MKNVLGGLIAAALLTVSVPVSAESPMTPLRLPVEPSGPRQWVEPPPAPASPAPDPGKAPQPVATAPIPPPAPAAVNTEKSPAAAATAPAPAPASAADDGGGGKEAAPDGAPAAAAEAEEPAAKSSQTEDKRRGTRSARASGQPRTAAGRLNRGELGRIRAGVPSQATSPYYNPYYYGYAPSPHADTGN